MEEKNGHSSSLRFKRHADKLSVENGVLDFGGTGKKIAVVPLQIMIEIVSCALPHVSHW